MTRLPDSDPAAPASPAAVVESLIEPRPRDIGGFAVRRVLPSTRRPTVGPFVFLDEMGPARMPAGSGLDVAPHPHIGLATVTYLLQGEILHRDSLGTVQPIAPGDVNWMTAGRGIAHSERTAQERRARPHDLHGLQFWVGLPQRHEEAEPAFAHHPAASLPEILRDGARIRVVAGSAFGATAPVATLSELFLCDAVLPPGARLALPPAHEERAAYLIQGGLEIGGAPFEPNRLLAFAPGVEVALHAPDGARLALFGGAPLDGRRHVWWNFVSRRPERIDQAKAAWTRDRMGLSVPEETEYLQIPG